MPTQHSDIIDGRPRTTTTTLTPSTQQHFLIIAVVLWLSVITRSHCFISSAPSATSRQCRSLNCPFLSRQLLPIQQRPRFSSSFSFDGNDDDLSNMWVRMDSPPAQRNKELIWKILLSEVLDKLTFPKVIAVEDDDDDDNESDPTVIGQHKPSQIPPVRVLEIAAGCGVHTQHFCLRMKKAGRWKDFVWYPTDPDASSRASIQSYLEEVDLAEDVVAPLPLRLDAHGIAELETRKVLFDESLDLMVCINMIHISPWDATVGLMKTAQEKLRPGGFLYCYGPFKVNGTAVDSNLRFDRNLRLRDASWGVRDLEKVQQMALECGLDFVKAISMPANNLSVLFRKQET